MRLSVMMLCCAMVACGSPLRRMPAERPAGVQSAQLGRMPIGPTERPVLRSIPQVSSYRWGRPSAHFLGLSATEDSLAMTFAAHELRSFGASVLRTNGWQESADSGSANFEFSIVEFERHIEETTRRDGARPAMRPEEWSRCRALPPAQRANCVEPPPPPARPGEPITGIATQRLVAFAIVRLSDSATAWWIVGRREDLLTTQIRLLAAPPEM